MSKEKGKITVTSIPKEVLDLLPDNTDDMTEEEIHKFSQLVFSKCVSYDGDIIDVSKLVKDFDNDELTYDPDSVVKDNDN